MEQTVRVDLLPKEFERLATLAQVGQFKWCGCDIDVSDGGNDTRVSSIVFDSANCSIRMSCLSVTFPFGSETFRLFIEQVSATREASEAPTKAPATILQNPALKEGGEFEIGTKVFLIYRKYRFEREGIVRQSEFVAVSPDALLICGRDNRVLFQVHPLPTWLSISVDSELIDQILNEATEIRML